MIGNLYRRLVQWLTGRGGVYYINGSDTLPPPLSKEAEAEAFARLGTGDAESARQTLIVHNLRLVVYIAKKFESTGIGIEDLVAALWKLRDEVQVHEPLHHFVEAENVDEEEFEDIEVIYTRE